MFQDFDTFLQQSAFSPSLIQVTHLLVLLLLLAITALFAYWFSRTYLVGILEKIAHKSTFRWDDIFSRNLFFKHLAILVPLVLIHAAADLVFTDFPGTAEFLRRASLILFVFAGLRIFGAVLRSGKDIYHGSATKGDWPVQSYLDALRIISYVLAFIFFISILTDKSPWGIISVFGGLTAILLLIFKDTIMGFVANLQLTANDMIRVASGAAAGNICLQR
ncbi:MAG: hypothetical protein K0A99_08525 [Desulfoarculaceae bacterium]|nr:hypothetical protein [Desulfoarculaceae bacterium]